MYVADISLNFKFFTIIIFIGWNGVFFESPHSFMNSAHKDFSFFQTFSLKNSKVTIKFP